jgi:DNA modification methylase
VRVIHGDCLDVLPTLPDNSIDAVVTDPPYGLGFMGQKWDTYANETGRAPSSKRHKFDHVGGNHNPSNSADAARTRRVEAQRFGEWCEGWTAECLRVLKPGGHMLAFGSTRTWHRLTCAVEDAGFEIRDTITWLYGSGFPKSLDVGKAIDKAAGAEREVVGTAVYGDGHVQRSAESIGYHGCDPAADQRAITAPATDAARQWQGWGTALKPASEPIIVARKPLTGTVAATVQAHGTGALNVDACRVGAGPRPADGPRGRRPRGMGEQGERKGDPIPNGPTYADGEGGRWPANVVLTHAEPEGEPCVPGCPVADLDAQSGTLKSGDVAGSKRNTVGGNGVTHGAMTGVIGQSYADTGGASRFFPTFRYQAKAPTSERPKIDGVAHPTVKPLALMRWLVRLVCPPGGTVLDPFAGSGTTGEAAVMEGFNAVLIERDPTYLPLIEQRRQRRQADTSGDQLTLVGG